jgi:hypothetical protein
MKCSGPAPRGCNKTLHQQAAKSMTHHLRVDSYTASLLFFLTRPSVLIVRDYLLSALA